MTSSDKSNYNQSKKRRKTYARPRLTCFGRIAHLTGAQASRIGNPDGAPGRWKMTGPPF